MKLKNEKVLVTGADGFIGSHLVERLVKEGSKVRAFVHYNSFNSWGHLDYVDKYVRDSVEIFPGDIRDSYTVKEAVKGCEIVFHLAALIAIPYSYVSPESYVDTNIGGTLNVVRAARELGIKKVLQTSTSEVYGTAQYVPIDERHPLQGQSPYAATKIGADQIAMSFYLSFGTPVVIVRPFNAYGPRQSARAVIPTIITQILSGKRKIHLGALNTTRDFNYVKDLADGFVKIAESDKSTGEVINLGSGSEISIGNLAHKIAGLIGAKISIESHAPRIRPEKSEVMRLQADNSKAKRLVGWKPKHSLDAGLKETIKWFSDPENLKMYKAHIYNI